MPANQQYSSESKAAFKARKQLKGKARAKANAAAAKKGGNPFKAAAYGK